MRKIKGDAGAEKGAAGCQAVTGTAGGAKSSPSPALLTLSFWLTLNATMMFGQLMFLPSVVGRHSPKIKCREDSFVFKGEASLLFNLLLCL